MVNTLKLGLKPCIRGISGDATVKRTEGFEQVRSLHLDSALRGALDVDRVEMVYVRLVSVVRMQAGG